MIDINYFAEHLELIDSIWYSTKRSQISFPKDGNQSCFQVEDSSFWFQHRNNCIKEIIKLFPPSGPIFDIGGGNGYVSKGIEETGCKVILVEPGEEGIANAKKRNITQLICSTIEDAGFKNGTMPAIGVFDVIEHLENDLKAIVLFNDLLIISGRLYLTVPAYNILWSNEDVDAGHFKRYTLHSIKKLLSKANFKIEYSTYIFSLLPVPIFLFRSIPSRLNIYKSSTRKLDLEFDHKNNVTILESLWKWEINKIIHKRKIPFGGSCLIVAQKI